MDYFYTKKLRSHKVNHTKMEVELGLDGYEELTKHRIDHTIVGVLVQVKPYSDSSICTFITEFGEVYCWGSMTMAVSDEPRC